MAGANESKRPRPLDEADHRQGQADDVGHVCPTCLWPFPNKRPCPKKRNSHRNRCGKIEGYPKRTGSGATIVGAEAGVVQDSYNGENDGQDDCHSSPKVIMLKSSDGEVFKIEENVALQFGTLKPMLDEEYCTFNTPINSNMLTKVIDYCKKHAESKEKVVDLKSFDSEFFRGVNQDTLFGITQAAHYFNIESLLDLTCHEIARQIKDMTVGKVRKFFNLTKDFTFHEENKIRKLYAAFEKSDSDSDSDSD